MENVKACRKCLQSILYLHLDKGFIYIEVHAGNLWRNWAFFSIELCSSCGKELSRLRVPPSIIFGDKDQMLGWFVFFSFPSRWSRDESKV